MKVLVINASPRPERSNTMNITRAFIKGFPEGTDVEYVTLNKLNIKPCLGCYSCWDKTPGKCVIKDDMGMLSDKIREADVIVQSFPLYFFGMPSQLKCMTDRCLPLTLPYLGNIVEDQNASFHELRDEEMHKKSLVVISTCGYVDAGHMYQSLIKQYDLIAGVGKYTAILCPEGELFVTDNAKRQREGYLSDVTAAGAEFAENRTLCETTKQKLAKPILSPKGFETITLAHWAQFR